MANEKKHNKTIYESNLIMFDLGLLASQIKNKNAFKDSVNALLNFVEGSKLRFSNP